MSRRRRRGRRRSQFCQRCQDRILNSGSNFNIEKPPFAIDRIDGVDVCVDCRHEILVEKGIVKEATDDEEESAVASAVKTSSIDERLSSPRLIDRLLRMRCICGKEIVPIGTTDDKQISFEPDEAEGGDVLLVTAAMLADLWGTRVRARSDEILAFVARAPKELAALDGSPPDQPRYRLHECERTA